MTININSLREQFSELMGLLEQLPLSGDHRPLTPNRVVWVKDGGMWVSDCIAWVDDLGFVGLKQYGQREGKDVFDEKPDEQKGA